MDRKQADHRLDAAIGYLLRIGVSVAAVIVLSGLILYLAHSNDELPDFSHFRGHPIHLSGAGRILSQALSLNSSGVIYLGILLLIATPVARVLFCIAGFAAEKDRFYIGVSSLVFAILVYALFFHH
jgi:uncharacterized membrane protein